MRILVDAEAADFTRIRGSEETVMGREFDDDDGPAEEGTGGFGSEARFSFKTTIFVKTSSS
jgi:hypothetical protein